MEAEIQSIGLGGRENNQLTGSEPKSGGELSGKRSGSGTKTAAK
jgi:hypothetical protein